jgi:DnaJ like chaperone protein
MKIVWILLALLYTLWPLDMAPDLIPGAGWIDDALLWLLILHHLFGQKAGTDDGRRDRRRRESGRAAESPGSPPNAARAPHIILDVAADAGPEEIKAAYRKLANQYHPDKVSHLGEEFQTLAEARFKEIQTAYRELMRHRR